MSSLIDRLNEDLKQAMRGGDTLKREVIRQALASVKKAEGDRLATLAKSALAKLPKTSLSPGEPPQLSDADVAALNKQSALSEPDILGIIQKEARQRQESIEAFKQGNRPELAAKEEAELGILQTYLPKQASRDEIAEEVRKVIAETGARGPGDKGKVMPKVMASLKGKADGREINEVVTDLLKA